MIIAIDPGTSESAIVQWDGERVQEATIASNEECRSFVRQRSAPFVLAVEMVACYGMPVGKEVFETCLQIGRIQEIAFKRCIDCRLIYRRDVKLHHCQNARAKDSNIRQALVDKYGAPGTKNQQGKTYGLKSHLWAAFAIATYVQETQILSKPDSP